jgi:cytochrome b561
MSRIAKIKTQTEIDMSTTTRRYTLPAMALHWVLGVAIVVAFFVGLFVHEMPFSPLKLKLMNWHKWAGVTILALSALRLVWRLTHRPPALPEAVTRNMPAWQMSAYHGTHHLMYLLFFIVPLAGWAYSSAKGFPVVWLGVLPLPDLVEKNDGLAQIFRQAHEVSAFALMGLVGLHVAAALKHHFIDKDGLLERMRPGRG